MTGFSGLYDYDMMDRLFRVRCCLIKVHATTSAMGTNCGDNWVCPDSAGMVYAQSGAEAHYHESPNYINNLNQGFYEGVPGNMLACGMISQKQDRDRRWKLFQCSYHNGDQSGHTEIEHVPADNHGHSAVGHWYANEFHGWLSVECPPGKAFVGIGSHYDSSQRDRMWRIVCSKLKGVNLANDPTIYHNGDTNDAKRSSMDRWTEYQNEWDSGLSFQCSQREALCGLTSRFQTDGNQ